MNLLALALLSATAVPGQPAGDFQHDFQGGQFDHTLLKLVGPDRDKFVHPEADGLRITLPAGQGPEAPVGVALRTPVSGDFEITAAFTILQIQPPKAGYGSGVVLQAIKESDTQEIASITRTWRPSQGEAFVANWVSKKGDKPSVKREDYPSEARSGKLRLVRRGPQLHYLIAEGDEAAFREIYHVNFGAEDLRAVRLVVDRGKSDGLLDVRLEELTVRTQPESPARSTGWVLWIALSVAAGLLFVAGCLVSSWFWRRKPALLSQPPPAKPKERPTVVSKSAPQKSS